MNVLIVDDQKQNLYMLDTLLKANGYDVVQATHGAEALEKLRGESFDLIVSDIMMPVMDGFQLCLKCKSDETLKYIPFIIYTSTYTEAKDESLAMKLGADKYIIKPIEPREFIRTVEETVKEFRTGNKVAGTTTPEDAEVLSELYTERIVGKLEKKVAELEKEVARRKEAEKTLQEAYDRVEQRVKERTAALAESNRDLQFEVEERTKAQGKLDKTVAELQEALGKVKTLKGLLPICASCKSIRDDRGYWRRIESYVHEHTGADFSHGICPDCAKKLYPEYMVEDSE